MVMRWATRDWDCLELGLSEIVDSLLAFCC